MEIRRRGKKPLLLILVVAVIAVLTFFLVAFITKTGIFKVYGKVYYDESLSESEISELEAIFTNELKLECDVTVSAMDKLEVPTVDNEILVSIKVPITDFYNPIDNIEVRAADELLVSEYGLIDFEELDFSKKLLKINDKYFLDDFVAGAVFRVIKFQSEAFEEEIAPLVEGLALNSRPEADNTLTFAQTGVTALSRGMHKKLNAVGNGAYFAEGIGEFLI